MLLSSHEMQGWPSLEGLAVTEYGVKDVGLVASQGDQGLVVPFALGSLAVVVGPPGGVALDRVERHLVEDALEGFVTSGRGARGAHLPGLGQHRCEAEGRRESVGAGEAAIVADRCDEFSG